MSNKLKIIFIGTPEFGVPAFKKIAADNNFNIIATITQPDKKVGRKQVLTPPPIKIAAQKNNINVFQPEKIKNFIKDIEELQPDLIIVIAYAQIIPEEILSIPKFGCINVHGSLLPKYRGASCIQAAILNGDKETGITIMKMDKGLDTGPIIAQKNILISEKDTAGSLYDKLADLTPNFLVKTISEYINKKILPQKQDDKYASYVKILKKTDGKINWSKSAGEIERLVRAMHPWPSAYSYLNNQKQIIKIIGTDSHVLNINRYEPGFLFTDGKQLMAKCGQGALVLNKLQIEGKKEISGKEFINGYKNLINRVLQ